MKTKDSYDLEALTDNELIKRCLKKDNRAWEVIVKRYGKKVFNIAYQFVGRVEEAKDLSQEIFLKILRSLEKFDIQAPFSYWLIKVSKNFCIDYYRKRQKERATIIHQRENYTAYLAEEHDPLRELEKKEKASMLREAFGNLPKSARACVIMRDIQGYSYREIAEALKIPEGTVKSRINRGRKLLAKLIKERQTTIEAN